MVNSLDLQGHLRSGQKRLKPAQELVRALQLRRMPALRDRHQLPLPQPGQRQLCLFEGENLILLSPKQKRRTRQLDEPIQ